MKETQNKKIHPSKGSIHAGTRNGLALRNNARVGDLFHQDKDDGSVAAKEELTLKIKESDSDTEVEEKE